MAIIQLGAIITKISGKVGGQTFGIGRNQQYLKNTGSYINKRTEVRQQANSLLAFVSGQWRVLTQIERDAWNAATVNFPYIDRLGDQAFYSGFQLFVKFNCNGQLVKQPIYILPPAPITVSGPINSTIVPTTSTFVIQGDISTTGVEYLIYSTPNLSQGITTNTKSLRLINFLTEAMMENSFNLFASFVNNFGALLVDQKIFVEIKTIHKATGIAAFPNTQLNAIVIN